MAALAPFRSFGAMNGLLPNMSMLPTEDQLRNCTPFLLKASVTILVMWLSITQSASAALRK